MKPPPFTDFSRLCIHTQTTRPWEIEHAAAQYAEGGVKGISIWRQAVEGRDLARTGERVRNLGLEIVSYVRGGFFPALDAVGLAKAVDENRRILDEAATLGAPMVVLVCGSIPGQALDVSRGQIRDGIAAILPHAEDVNVRLAIEPLHPVYAADRSAVVTLRQANDLAEALDSPFVGVAVDVYHVWWDEFLEGEIARCGINGNLFAFHICDWKSPTVDVLNDRGLMGEGCIAIRQIRSWIDDAGFDGYCEVEIFSDAYWSGDQDMFLKKILYAYLQYA